MRSKMLELPATQTAIVAQGPGELAIQHDVPMPALTSDMVIVKTAAVAINPADAKMLDYSAAAGAIMGYDYAGTVVALGSEAACSGKLAIGDRVAGLVRGMNKLLPQVSAFSEYVGASADLLLKIPDSMTFEQGASFGTGVATACLSLCKELGIPATLEQLAEGEPAQPENREDRHFVLVAGGSTATGTRAIQLLKLAGLRPIATASASNFTLAERFGAEKVFDYNSPMAAHEIREYTGNELAYTFDCVSQADTIQLCHLAMGRAGGRYVALEPFRDTVVETRALTIKPSWVMVLTIFGRQVALDGEYGRKANLEDRVFGGKAFAAVQALLNRGLIDTHPIKFMPGGWEGVCEGVDMIRTQAMSGQKLVCSVA